MTQEEVLEVGGEVESDSLDGFVYRDITINSSRGLHARPTQAIQKIRDKYEGKANLEVCLNEEGYLEAGSFVLMSLAAEKGTVVEFRASGDYAEELLEKVENKLEDFAKGIIE